MPTIPELILVALSLTSTGLLALVVFISLRAIGAIEKLETAQTEMIKAIVAMQEQIKTLFNHNEDRKRELHDLHDIVHDRRSKVRT